MIMFSQPWYALFVKNSLPFMTTQQVNSTVYKDLDRFSYIYTNGAQPAAFDNEICGRPHVI